jgi:hypothetical protein
MLNLSIDFLHVALISRVLVWLERFSVPLWLCRKR